MSLTMVPRALQPDGQKHVPSAANGSCGVGGPEHMEQTASIDQDKYFNEPNLN